jgi:hypothetical protein
MAFPYAVALSVALVGPIATAQADPLIDIPTARKLPYGDFKLEFADESSETQTQLAWFDAGIGKSFEATFEAERFGREPVKTSEDFMYNVISAIPGLAPGIAFGVEDIANTSQDGRRPYAVITYREATQTFDGDIPFDLSVGTYFKNRLYPFVGMSLPLSHKIRVIGEFDGFRPVGGLEFQSSHALTFRLLVRGGNTLGDVVWTSHF